MFYIYIYTLHLFTYFEQFLIAAYFYIFTINRVSRLSSICAARKLRQTTEGITILRFESNKYLDMAPP